MHKNLHYYRRIRRNSLFPPSRTAHRDVLQHRYKQLAVHTLSLLDQSTSLPAQLWCQHKHSKSQSNLDRSCKFELLARHTTTFPLVNISSLATELQTQVRSTQTTAKSAQAWDEAFESLQFGRHGTHMTLPNGMSHLGRNASTSILATGCPLDKVVHRLNVPRATPNT